jgi:hypothetical protein
MILAQATQIPPPAPSVLGMLLPWLFLGPTLGIILALMARRKGRNPILWFFVGFTPLVGFFAALVLASRPDVSLLKRLWALEDKLANITGNPQPPRML